MTLYPIHAQGIKAYCSDIIIDDEEIVHFMSICGYQATVKGIIANFLEYNGLELTAEKNYYLTRSYQSYSFYSKKLPSGLIHSIIIPTLSLAKNEEKSNSFFIFTENENLQDLFFLHLDDKTDIPLHPSWARWLWKTFQDHSWLYPLTTIIGTLKGYRIEFIPLHLQELISEAMENKTPEILNCMKRNGDLNYELTLP